MSRQHGRVRFFHLTHKGVGRALREGVRMAAYDRIITVDMDLSISLDFIPEAYRMLDHSDMVIGKQNHRRTTTVMVQEDGQQPLYSPGQASAQN